MEIIARADLLAVLTGTGYDPMVQYPEEMAAFANAILAHAPAEATHFVYSDAENGEDLEIVVPEYCYTVRAELIPVVYNREHTSYYGLTAVQHDQYGEQPDSRVLYSCIYGGSPMNSAIGFAIATARLVGPVQLTA